MMTSAWASGFPQFMVEVCKNLEFEELLKTRLVSVTFYNFLMHGNQRSIWIHASSKVFFTFRQNAYDAKKFPLVKRWVSQGWFTEDMKNNLQKEWIQVFEKIQKTATIQQIIKICHLLRETEKPGKFCESVWKNSLSMFSEMSKMFTEQDSHLSEQIMRLNITPSMIACCLSIVRKRRIQTNLLMFNSLPDALCSLYPHKGLFTNSRTVRKRRIQTNLLMFNSLPDALCSLYPHKGLFTNSRTATVSLTNYVYKTR